MDNGWLDSFLWTLDHDPTVDGETLAAWLGLDHDRFAEFVEVGIIPVEGERDGQPRFNLPAAVGAFAKWAHSWLGDTPLTYAGAKTHSLVQLARSRRLVADQLAGRLVESSGVERTWNAIGVEYAQRWRALPSRLARDLSLSVAKTRQVQKTVDEILRDFANASPDGDRNDTI